MKNGILRVALGLERQGEEEEDALTTHILGSAMRLKGPTGFVRRQEGDTGLGNKVGILHIHLAWSIRSTRCCRID